MREKPSAGRFVEYYYALYKRKTGFPLPLNWVKHTVLIKRLLSQYDEQTVLQFLNFHVNSSDEFVRNSGHSLSTLPSQIPKYIEQISPSKNPSRADFEKLNGIEGQTHKTTVGDVL